MTRTRRLGTRILLGSLLCGVCLVGIAAAGPSLGPERTLDHGFRYPDPTWFQTMCAVAPSSSDVLFAYGSGETVFGFRRHPDGREIDVNGTQLVPESLSVAAFDLSGHDGIGWKMAYITRPLLSDQWHDLWMRNVASGTSLSIGPPMLLAHDPTASMEHVSVVFNGTHHLVAWISRTGEERSIYLSRVRPDMAVEDLEPILISRDEAGERLTLAADAAGGLVAWSVIRLGRGASVLAQRLDAEGRPEGPVIETPAGSNLPSQIDACRYRDGWLVAWVAYDHVRAVWLDAGGEILSPGALRWDTEPNGTSDLAVAAIDSTGFIFRRGDYGSGVRLLRVVARARGWSMEEILLAGEATFISWEDRIPLHTLDCAPVGPSLAIVWNTGTPPEGAARSGTGSSRSVRRPVKLGGTTYGSDWPAWPVYAQWIGQDGHPLLTEPLVVSQASHPLTSVVQRCGTGFVAMMKNADTELYVHTQPLSAAAEPLGPATRIRTPAQESSYHGPLSSDTWWLGGIGTRSAAGNGLLLYGLTHAEWYDSYGFTDYYLVMDEVDPTGELTRRLSIRPNRTGEFPDSTRPITFDVARGQTSYLTAYSFSRGSRSEKTAVRATLLGNSGTPIRFWEVGTGDSCMLPSVVAGWSRYLLIWRQGADSRFYWAVVNPADESGRVTGQPLAPSLGASTSAQLIAGQDQVLCVFDGTRGGVGQERGVNKSAGASTTDADIYTLRFNSNFEPIDPEPIPLCPSPGTQGYPRGVWDGRQYVVTWSNLDPGRQSIVLGRVAAGGAVRDSIPFEVAADIGYPSPASLASDQQGTVLLAYGKDRVRAFQDDNPLLYTPPVEPPVEPPASSVSIGEVRPNPSRGTLRWSLSLPVGMPARVEVFDAGGRLVHAEAIVGRSTETGWIWDGRMDDGHPAPAGSYHLRIQAGGRSETRSMVIVR